MQYTGGANTLGKSITIGAGNGTISNTGGGALTLTGGIAKNGTVLTLTGTNTINVNGAISGASANSDLVVDNVTVNLNVANTYVGPTYIRSSGTAGLGILNANVVGALPTGTPSDVIMDDLGHGGSQLVLGASQSIASLTGAASSFVKLNAWTLTIGTGSGSTFAGVISGTGSLIKDGSNTLTLTGANTYTGTTTLTSGEVNLGVAEIAGTSGPLGQSAANNPGSIVLNGGYLQYSDANQNDYSGRFSTASAQQYNVDTNSQNVTWATALTSSGGGSLTKTGLGTLTLTGANTYTGATTVNAGTLQAGVATQAFGVGSAVTLNSTATLDLGGYSQTIGSLTENSGSILKLTVSSPSSFGNITTTGAVTLNTNPVNVVVAGYIPNNASLRVINAGTPMTAGSPLLITTTENGEFVYTPRVNFIGSIVNGDLILTADHSTTGFVSLADNPNARAAGRALDNVTNPSSDMTNVLNTLEFLNDAKTTSALNTMGPIADRGVLDSSTAALNNFIGASIERAQNVLTLASSGNSKSTGVSSGDDSKLNGLWAKQYGSYLDQGTRDGIQGYNAWNAGTAVGVDRLVNDNFTLGVSVGYAYSKVDSDVNGASTDIQSAQGTLYAGYQGTNLPYYIDLAGSFAENWYNGQRNITVDTMNRIADASYNGQQSGVYFEGGYKFSLGNNLEITPLTSLQWTHLSLGSYTESNAGALDLNVNRQSYDILESGLGASIAYPVKYNWGNFTPEVHAKWLYDFINDNMVVTSAFTGGGGSFTSAGASPARNGANIGGKLSFDFKNNISVIAGVDTEMKDNFFGVSGTVAVRYKF